MANTNFGLGRRGLGLEALLGPEANQEESKSLTLPISKVECNADQPRKRFDEEKLTALAESIKANGILQPLTVRRLPSGDYQIVAGERRWRAARIAGLKEVPVVVIEANEQKMTELALIENLQREDLDPLEEAEGYKKLMDSYHMTQEDVAVRVGKSRSTVANALRLLSLCPEVRALVEQGKLSGGHARTLLPLSAALQKKAAQTVVGEELSVRQTEALVKRLNAKPAEEKKQDPEKVNYAKLAASELAEKLGRGCRIVTGRKKGRIELDYYGMDDLNDLLEALALIKKRKGK
jgi:ParB family chromosome partitioning protein